MEAALTIVDTALDIALVTASHNESTALVTPPVDPFSELELESDEISAEINDDNRLGP